MKNKKEYKRKKREQFKKRYKNNVIFREKKKNINKKSRRKVRLKILIQYGGNPPKCACCGEKEIKFLGVDHIKNDGAKHRKKIGGGSTHLYFWLSTHKHMPNVFQILCYNCNLSKGFYKKCPHKSFCQSKRL